MLPRTENWFFTSAIFLLQSPCAQRPHPRRCSVMPQDIAPPPARSAQLDAAALEAALRRHLRGEVRFDAGSRALYATDGSNYRQVPIGVVLPRDADDVVAAITLAREFSATILCRGGGTYLAGQCCNVAVVL